MYFNIGFVLQEKLELLASIKAFEKGIAILKKIYKTENEQFADFYDELGYTSFLLGDFNKAEVYLQKAKHLKLIFGGAQNASLVYTYKYLGVNYQGNESFGEAINYFNKAITLLRKQTERDYYQEAMLYFRIGNSYLSLKEYENAFRYFDKAIDTDNAIPFLVAETDRFRGVIASKKGKRKEAYRYFENAINGFQKHVKNSEKYLINVYQSLVNHELKNENYHLALHYINKTIEIGNIAIKEQTNQFFDIYLLKGKCYRLMDNSDLAKLNYKKAAQVNGGEIEPSSANLKQLKNCVSLNLEYANLYLKEVKKENSFLLKTDSLLEATIELVSYINHNYQERSTKENFIEEYHRIFKKAIQVKFELHQLTQNKHYLEAAFMLSEKSKNLILLETINNVNALEAADIPPTITDNENKLRTRITYLENKRYEAQQKSVVDEQLIRKLNGQIFDLKQQRQTLVQQIELDYPKYYQLKFEPKAVTISEIQKQLLSPQQGILEYFVGDNSLYAFLIKKADFQIFTLPKSKNLDKKINHFRKNIYSYRSNSGMDWTPAQQTLIRETNELGFELYQLLFAPLQAQLPFKITVIAEGALGYLPFDALISKPPKDFSNFEEATYLIENHVISHAHSANWLSSLQKNEAIRFEQNFIGIAPAFEEKGTKNSIADFRIGLGALRHNQEEVDNIQKSIGGKVIKGVQATKKAFLDYIHKGQILHLATHGKSNDQKGDYSYLAFAKPQMATEHQFLYVKDLFNLTIPADLVVLSACETGLGEIKRGEGIVGIGKGFSYAGAKSMVATLWRVSDNSTANFMPIFYKNLKQGLPKDEALWKAKKEFIKTYQGVGHPFFWSGYVAYGNMQAIQFQYGERNKPLLFGSLFGGAFLIMLFFWAYTKHTPQGKHSQ